MKGMFEEQLIVSNLTLSKLKANVHTWALQNMIDQLKADWKPKMITLEGKVYDRPDTIDEPYDVLYWDEVNAKWTNRAAAFKSYVFAKIQKYI